MSMRQVIESIECEAYKKYIGQKGTSLRDPKGPECDKLKEHRCSCGRLLGRFSGQAEVKCPKCGKLNVIGVEKVGKSEH